jgi:hypothetical protein
LLIGQRILATPTWARLTKNALGASKHCHNKQCERWDGVSVEPEPLFRKRVHL